MTLVDSFLEFMWHSTLLLGPMLMLGLLLSGLIHVFVSRNAVLRWLKKDSFKAVSASAAIGVPIPLCSCSVVPVVTEMRNKGASRSACMSFLITAPETGADSILVTNAFFGWIAAIVRPLVSFITAVIAGLNCIGMERKNAEHEIDAVELTTSTKTVVDDCCSPISTPDQGALVVTHDDCCENDHAHVSLIPNSDDCYVSLREFKNIGLSWLRSARTRVRRRDSRLKIDAPPADGLTLRKLGSHIFKYGFIEIADDILFALLFGLLLGGLLYLAIPSDLLQHEYARWVAYPIMLIFAVPLYICASASTPIAAGLVAKGMSPGAALIFLMAGPATNTGTISIVISQFGSKFASIYVGTVVVVTVVLGIAIDLLLLSTGFSLVVNLQPSEHATIQWIQLAGAFGLIALIVWRFANGALQRGYNDLIQNLKPNFASKQH